MRPYADPSLGPVLHIGCGDAPVPEQLQRAGFVELWGSEMLRKREESQNVRLFSIVFFSPPPACFYLIFYNDAFTFLNSSVFHICFLIMPHHFPMVFRASHIP